MSIARSGLGSTGLEFEIKRMAGNANRKKALMVFGWRLLGCAAIVGLQIGSASAKEAAPQTVWAKAGVSYEQYRGDALECGKQGLASDIDNTQEVKTLARASQQLEGIDASGQTSSGRSTGATGQPDMLEAATNRAIEQQTIIAATQPERQYAGIKQKMFVVVRSCMIKHGYAKVVLTENQRKEYEGIKGSADVRRAYIHKIASDPHVLETQRQVTAQ